MECNNNISNRTSTSAITIRYFKNEKKFTNWLNEDMYQPRYVIKPLHTEDLIQAIHLASKENLKIRVRGCGSALPATCRTTHVLVDITSLNKPLKIDKENMTVEVEAGMTVRQLNEYLRRHHLALSVQGLWQDVTIGGAIITATHGSGITFGIMASYVSQMTLVTAKGEVKTLSRDQDSELFRCIPGSLGMLGILASVTIKCEKMYNLHHIATSVPVSKVFDNLEQEMNESEHFEFNYCPGVEGAQVKRYNRTPKEDYFQPELKPLKKIGMSLGDSFSQFCYLVSSVIPSAAHSACRLERFTFQDDDIEEIGPGFQICTADDMPNTVHIEWAFPVQHTRSVLQDIETWVLQHKFPIHNGIRVRFSCKDDFFLSPAYDRDTCWIEFTTYKPFGRKLDHSVFYKSLETIMVKYEGRPHWAKMLLESDYEFLFPEWNTFLDLKKTLDPDGIFSNQYLEAILV